MARRHVIFDNENPQQRHIDGYSAPRTQTMTPALIPVIPTRPGGRRAVGIRGPGLPSTPLGRILEQDSLSTCSIPTWTLRHHALHPHAGGSWHSMTTGIEKSHSATFRTARAEAAEATARKAWHWPGGERQPNRTAMANLRRRV